MFYTSCLCILILRNSPVRAFFFYCEWCTLWTPPASETWRREHENSRNVVFIIIYIIILPYLHSDCTASLFLSFVTEGLIQYVAGKCRTNLFSSNLYSDQYNTDIFFLDTTCSMMVMMMSAYIRQDEVRHCNYSMESFMDITTDTPRSGYST